MSTNPAPCLFLALAVLAGSPHAAQALDSPLQSENEEVYSSYGDEGSLARASQNPVANLISLPLQNNFLFLEDTGDLLYNLNVQPVVPFNLNEDWNLITRTIIPFFALENAPARFDSAGLGDINTSLFFSPAQAGKVIWGAGPILSFPTATDDLFGSGKWSAGPAAVALTMRGPWVFGALANNVWSYAGDDDRRSVNAMLVQPFINYNLDKGWFLVSAPVITADWKRDHDERWTVPLGGGFGRVFPIGRQPVNTSLQAFYNVERPSGGPEWSIRWNFQFLFPR